MKRRSSTDWLVAGLAALGIGTGSALAAEPSDLLALAKTGPKPPWPAGDELGMANTLGEASTRRCAWHMAQPGARWYEASQVRSNTMPKTPFGGPGGLKPKPTAAVPFSRHVFNSEVYEADAEPGQQGTQIDALGHFASIGQPWDPKTPLVTDGAAYYGGFTQKDMKPTPESPLMKLGIEKIPPLVTTAVVLDAQAHVGKGKPMTAGQLVTRADIEAMVAAQKLAERGILPGDMVWIHTGWSVHWKDPAGDTPYYNMAPGLSVDAADYLGSLQVVAVGLDTPFIDPVPEGMMEGKAPPAPGTPEGLPFAIHHMLISKYGIHHLESMRLAELARDRVWTACAMVLPPLDKGAAGAAVRPVAIGLRGQ